MSTQEKEEAREVKLTPRPRRKGPATPDLSAEIQKAVQRLPGDRVRCRRVSENAYRCNWLAADRSAAADGAMFIETWKIRESRFLRAVKSNGKLVIEDMTLTSSGRN